MPTCLKTSENKCAPSCSVQYYRKAGYFYCIVLRFPQYPSFRLHSVILFSVSVGWQTAVRHAERGHCCSAASTGSRRITFIITQIQPPSGGVNREFSKGVGC
ncbi:hypothetical protein ILYODFUR_027299 [Ilyodon furcidens]|uniref:Uncharacterized protein n=1 Tax=Ilyodon furcidens TaxID=33524 RepID=A0ABV0UVL1_9TELE